MRKNNSIIKPYEISSNQNQENRSPNVHINGIDCFEVINYKIKNENPNKRFNQEKNRVDNMKR